MSKKKSPSQFRKNIEQLNTLTKTNNAAPSDKPWDVPAPGSAPNP